MNETVDRAYEAAREQYLGYGVDPDRAREILAGIPVSLNCWQGDDVRGFEGTGSLSDGGLAVTGGHPGRARNADELRDDLEMALSLIPGRHRVNLHAIYAEDRGPAVDRDGLSPEHFAGWIDWARGQALGLDMNPTFFAHPLAADGFTLSHPDEAIRRFWVDHGIACRRIGAAMGRALGSPCVTNVWVPDGYKDEPADRRSPRARLWESLDAVFAEPIDPRENLDAVEGKLFGLGTEAYVVGSHELYFGYAAKREILLCLDTGHFHPTESVADKVSSILLALDRLLLHVSRGVRWDSDHVVTLTDEVLALAREVVRGDVLDRVHLALDFFDASINRVAAWTIGTRSLLKALLAALLEPAERLRRAEESGDLTARLAIAEEAKTLPLGAVWDYHCRVLGVAPGLAYLDEIRGYERDVLAKRE